MSDGGSSPATLIWVGLAAAVWCAVHSLLIDPVSRPFWWGLLRRHVNHTRLAYNIFSLASLVILLWWWHRLPTRTLFTWPGTWFWLQVAGLTAAVLLLLAGMRVYDNRHFLGLAQIRTRQGMDRPPSPRLQARGVLLHMRHPYYSAALLVMIFGSAVTEVNLVWRAVFSVYVVVGTWLEERKLLAEFGQEYRSYCQQVPMFWPRLKPAAWPPRAVCKAPGDRRTSPPPP